MLVNKVLFWGYILSILFIFIVVFIDKRKPESTVTWILILLFIPYVGVILYLLFLDEFRFKSDIKRKRLLDNINDIFISLQRTIEDKDVKTGRIISSLITLNNSSGSEVTLNNDIKVYTSGTDKYRELFGEIADAQKFIHISYYIIKKDKYGRELIDLLAKKANEGVEVRLIFDPIGSKIFGKRVFKSLIKAGGHVEKFVSFKPSYLNHRNHCKIVVIDGQIAYMGGMNIGKEYCNEDKKITPWMDRHIRVHGDGVKYLQMQFLLDYSLVSKEVINLNDKDIIKKYFPPVDSDGNKEMQIVVNRPDCMRKNIKDAYLKMINDAKECILIETPYLILDDAIISCLKIAIKSGVDVTIIIPGIPDKKIVYLATLSYARELINIGAKIYTYRGFMHSKVLVCDSHITSIGSANLDIRSFYLDFEINAFIYNNEFNRLNKKLIEKDLENSEFLNENIKEKNKFGLWLENIFRLFTPIL